MWGSPHPGGPAGRRRRWRGHERTNRARGDIAALRAVRDRLAAWLRPRGKEAMGLMPVAVPVEDRAADTWEPLVIVADLAGGDWPERARTACRVLTAYEAAQDQDNSLHTRILVDIRRVFAACGNPAALPTRTILGMPNRDEEAPWADVGAQGLCPRHLQLLLKPYDIGSSTRRFPEGIRPRASPAPSSPTPGTGTARPKPRRSPPGPPPSGRRPCPFRSKQVCPRKHTRVVQ
ncbi:DUF3631 domain-containing protein [Streptomyces sp. R33]|uniref:DUF3631 domain-containing protein n=1 Tax=Streptomyces sp. R33 TaxID=3238629 RepID=A0AB39Y4I7_9ACTN